MLILFVFLGLITGGPTWVRTRDLPVMSRWLFQLSYGPPPHPIIVYLSEVSMPLGYAESFKFGVRGFEPGVLSSGLEEFPFFLSPNG
jgi:hypothetical protein